MASFRGLFFDLRQERFVLFRGGGLVPEETIEKIFAHNISFFNTSHYFGEASVGSNSSLAEFVVINTSLLTARIFPTLRGDTRDFEILTESPVIVPFNQTSSIKIRFCPTKTGKREAWLQAKLYCCGEEREIYLGGVGI